MTFDPYEQWLRIPPDRRPPTFYDLLGLPAFESDADRVRDAAMDRLTVVRKYHIGSHSAEASQLSGELSSAFDCLADPQRRSVYDAQLRGSTMPLAAVPVLEVLPAPVDTRSNPDNSIESIVEAALGRPESAPAPPSAPAEPPPARTREKLHPAWPPARRRRAPRSFEGVGKKLKVIAVISGLLIVMSWINSVSTRPRDQQPHESIVRPVVAFSLADQAIEAGDTFTLKVARPDESTVPEAASPAAGGRFWLESPSPAEATIDPINGTLTWATESDQAATDYEFTVRYEADDESLPSYLSTLKVVLTTPTLGKPTSSPGMTAANQAQLPLLAEIPDQTISVGQIVSIYLRATQPLGSRGNLMFALQAAPPGASIDARSGFFRWKAEPRNAGSRFVVCASVHRDDQPTGIVTRTFTIRVNAASTTGNLSNPLAGLSDQQGPRVKPGVEVFFAHDFKDSVPASWIGGQSSSIRHENDVCVIANSGSRDIVSMDVGVRASNFIFEAVGRVVGGSTDRWGLEVGEAGNFDRARATGVWLNRDGRVTCTLPDMRTVAGKEIRLESAFNALLVVVRGDRLNVFVNGQPAADTIATGISYAPGTVRLALYARGGARAEFQRIQQFPVEGADGVPELPKAATPLAGTVPEAPKPAEPKEVPKDEGVITNSIGMRLKLIPAGEFMMGSPTVNAGLPVHRVRISRPFYLGVYEVTNGEYRKFDASVGGARDEPVSRLRWKEAYAFCNWLSREDGAKYRLPTEAEWEYACRAGTTTEWSSGDNSYSLRRVGNVNLLGTAGLPGRIPFGNGNLQMVGRLEPNAFGLYDMHGNVWEWCGDWFNLRYYQNSPTDNPTGPGGGQFRVTRGGAFNEPAELARSAHRGYLNPDRSYSLEVGFRVVRTYTDKPAPPPAAKSIFNLE